MSIQAISISDRKQKILEMVNQKGSVNNAELSQLFSCSEVTIRTDIRTLASEGLIRRTRGGAVSLQGLTEVTQSLSTVTHYVAEKKTIARCAFSFIESGNTILIDDSSTSYYLASHIIQHPEKPVTVVTNGLRAAYELSQTSHVALHVIGGYVGGQSGGHMAATLGDIATESIQNFHVDKAFIGVHSINPDVGLTSIAIPQMQVKRAIINCAKNLFVLADHTKFDNGYLSVVCPLSDKFTIITDDEISASIADSVREAGVNLMICKIE